MWQTLSRYFVTVPESRNVEASRPDYIKPYLTVSPRYSKHQEDCGKDQNHLGKYIMFGTLYVSFKKCVTLMCDNKQEAKL